MENDTDKQKEENGKIDLLITKAILFMLGLMTFYFHMYVVGSIFLSALLIVHALETGCNAIIPIINEKIGGV